MVKDSCSVQHAKEIQNVQDLQKPIFTNIPADQLSKLCREELQQLKASCVSLQML